MLWYVKGVQRLSLKLFSTYIDSVYEQERNNLIHPTEVVRDTALYKPEVRDLYRLPDGQHSFVYGTRV
jgi:hypothetical protein